MIKNSLSGIWQYACFPNIEIPQNTTLFDEHYEWNNIIVPSCWDMETDIPRRLEGSVVYKKNFTLEIIKDEINMLNFDAVNYYCKVWLNGTLLGENEGGWNRFQFDITQYLQVAENTLYVLVIKQGETFPAWETTVGFLPDIVYTYGGVYREVSLLTYNKLGIKRLILDGDPKNNKITVKCHCFNYTDTSSAILRIDVVAPSGEKLYVEHYVTIAKTDSQWISGGISIKSPVLWDLENPKLYEITVSLLLNGQPVDSLTKKVGMRSIELKGSDILLNNSPIYVRGVLHWGFYPDIISPNPTKEQIKDEILKVKAHGFNMIKHCLYIPTDDYFELADEMGLLLWQEFPMWLPDMKEALIERYNREYPLMMEKIAGHPSTVIYTIGCELNDTVPESFLKGLYDIIKENSMGALITDNSGSGECYGSTTTSFAEFYDYHFYAELHNFENLMEVFTPHCRKEKPWLYGEFCDYDTICDRDSIIEQCGETPWWLSKNLDRNPIYKNCHHYSSNGRVIPLMEQDIILQSQPYCLSNMKRIVEASMRQGFLHRKFCLEETRKFPEACGYNITVITDSSLSSSGIFDYKMDSKFDSDLFRNFNGDDVLALSWDLKRTWKNGGDRVAYADRYNYFAGDTISFHMVLSYYSKKMLVNPVTCMRLMLDGEVLCEQQFTSNQTLQCSEVKELFAGKFTTPTVQTPKKVTLYANVLGTDIENQWDFYVYPMITLEKKQTIGLYDPTGEYVELSKIFTEIDSFAENDDISQYKTIFTTRLDNKILSYIENGGNVCYVQNELGRLPVINTSFWRESVRMVEKHPITEDIFFDGGMELNTFGVAVDAAFNVNGLELFNNIKPIFVRVDGRRYTAAYYMFEGDYGSGKIIGTTLRFVGGHGKQPSGVQRNKYAQVLIQRIINYFA